MNTCWEDSQYISVVAWMYLESESCHWKITKRQAEMDDSRENGELGRSRYRFGRSIEQHSISSERHSSP